MIDPFCRNVKREMMHLCMMTLDLCPGKSSHHVSGSLCMRDSRTMGCDGSDRRVKRVKGVIGGMPGVFRVVSDFAGGAGLHPH
jgi:hypothetical protein